MRSFPLYVVKVLRSIADAIELFTLRRLAYAAPMTGPWFASLQQSITSELTNTEDKDPSSFNGPPIFQTNHNLPLPYPPIVDDTEAISGLIDLVKNGYVKPGQSVLNLGGGAFDGGPKWLEQQVPKLKVMTADPFRRSSEHNISVQAQIESLGGVDVVISISVLNVIPETANRVAHIALAHRTLKTGGLAYFKVWADCWPVRGLGVGHADMTRGNGTYQVQRWAHAYLAEVGAVFGDSQVFADPVANMLVAVKA